MKEMINTVHLEGRVYDHSLAVKTSQKGVTYIGGSLEVAVDEEGLNVVPVNFTYVTPTYAKSGAENKTYLELAKIIDGATWVSGGKDAAIKVKVDANAGLNDFYNRDGELVSAKRAEGRFVTIVSSISDENGDKFTVDMVITNVNHVEANEERHIDADYTVVKGYVFNFRNAILPVEFNVRTKGGMDYFEGLEVSPKSPVFTKVWGAINCQTIVTTISEESAFGESAVSTRERKVKSWDITGTSKAGYDFGDEAVLTADELKAAIADRETYLADVKKRADEYAASKAPTSAPSAGVSAATGAFNF